MTLENNTLPDSGKLKEQAKRLRATLADAGQAISHAQALELIAKQHGVRDWNTLAALAGRPVSGNRPAGPPVAVGQTVTGRYLGQEFIGTVHAVASQLMPGRWRITLQLDEPVDVVTFESFSAFRSRISATINQEGSTAEKTSNGVPQLVLDL
ncbi:MAG: hypothetical protein KDJ66_06770 [Nitratireductor sp.]|nr:hypothetical protein [Nitratireductor sp.]MCB1456828.1 hypothetical protein [Nitratireductor sp.]